MRILEFRISQNQHTKLDFTFLLSIRVQDFFDGMACPINLTWLPLANISLVVLLKMSTDRNAILDPTLSVEAFILIS